jgi:hypothetical protein
MKQLIIAAAFVLTATSAAFAQFVYGSPGYGYYDAAPGYYYGAAPGYGTATPGYGSYGAGPGYGYDGSGPAWSNNTERGGPGPRVGAGSGMGVGSQR